MFTLLDPPFNTVACGLGCSHGERQTLFVILFTEESLNSLAIILPHVYKMNVMYNDSTFLLSHFAHPPGGCQKFWNELYIANAGQSS